MNESCSMSKIHALPLTVACNSSRSALPSDCCVFGIITCDHVRSKILSEYLAETAIKTNILIKITEEVIEINSRFSAG